MTQQTISAFEDRLLALLYTRHVGRQRAIKAKELAAKLGETERLVRATISGLRKQGHLILSAVQEPYGYFTAETYDEWREFRNGNLRPRALDILETDRAMNEAARQRWGDTLQLSMFQPAGDVVCQET